MIARRILSFLALLGAVLNFSPAFAQTIVFDEGTQDDWRFSVTPYLFLPVTTTGTSTVDGASVDVDLDLADVFDALNFAASMRAEVWKGDFGLMTDLYYVHLGGGATESLPGVGSARVDISVKQGWVAVLAGYRFLEGSYGAPGALRRYAFDAGAGFRYNNLHQKVDAKVNIDIGPSPGFQSSLGGTEVWFEPTFTLRGGVEVSESWTLAARADIGGFGVGGDNLQWIVVAGADYQPWEDVSFKIGWQFYGIDFATNRSDGRFAYDVFETGPYLGATFRF